MADNGRDTGGTVRSGAGAGAGGAPRKRGGTKLMAALFGTAVAGVALFSWVASGKEGPREEERRNTVITQDNVDETIKQMAEEDFVEPGYYTVSMNYDWHFEKGDAVSRDAWVENVVGNTNRVCVDVFLAGDEENAIYKSPVIPQGSELRDIALDTPLDAGTHKCVAVYHLLDDRLETVSTLRMELTITVDG